MKTAADLLAEAQARITEVTPGQVLARRDHCRQFAAVFAFHFEPRVHPRGEFLGLLRIKLQLLAQRGKFRSKIV